MEITLLPNTPLKTISWVIYEYLEVSLYSHELREMELCLIELNEQGSTRCSQLSLVPEWYDIPKHLVLGIRHKNTYYLKGSQRGYTYLGQTEINYSMNIKLSALHLISVQKQFQCLENELPNIEIQYIDSILYDAIHQCISQKQT